MALISILRVYYNIFLNDNSRFIKNGGKKNDFIYEARKQELKNKLITFSLSILMVAIPAYTALHLLKSSRAISFKGDEANYLSHLKPPKSTQKIEAALRYDLEKVVKGGNRVPRVFMVRLPENLPLLRQVKIKKKLFTETLLPLILRANELIRQDRAELMLMAKKLVANTAISKREHNGLNEMRNRYRMGEQSDSLTLINKLLKRVDIIPPSLALSQAAIESGWGTSYFAQKGNALFGQWVYGDNAKGMLPRRRNKGANHKIKSFDYLLDSVSSYMVNLNSHKAYQELRNRRLELRTHSLPITGSALAPALISYSERGQPYVNDLLSVMNYNKFIQLDNAQLEAL